MARRPHSEPRHDLILKAQAFVRAGFYDHPEIEGPLRKHIEETSSLLWDELKAVPVGRGSEYRDCVGRAYAHLFDEVLVASDCALEVANRGARIDIEFPLRLEVLHRFPLFKTWAEWYDIRSVLVEVKNEKRVAAVEDVKQLVGDLAVAGRGRFGFLTTRKGVSKPAMRYLGELASRHEYLVLPLSHDDLGSLFEMRPAGCEATMAFLRAKQTELLRAA